VSYVGTGKAVVAGISCTQVAGGRADQVVCAPVDVTVAASNVSVAAAGEESYDEPLDPYADGGPPQVNPFADQVIPKPAVLPATPGCSKNSQNPSFKISQFFWANGGVSFDLKNTALDYEQRCSVQGGRSARPQTFNCTRFDPNHSNYPSQEVFTTVVYGGPQNTLGINQTWYCADENAAKP
jgi:hypothetical protein